MIIFRGDIWTVYNPNRTVIREVVVISNDNFNRFSNWYQVIPLDESSAGRKHPYDVRIRGKIVAIDLMTTTTKSFFVDKKSAASPADMERISAVLLEHLALN